MRGVFGAPTCFVGDQLFFGQDRLDFVREALTRPSDIPPVDLTAIRNFVVLGDQVATAGQPTEQQLSTVRSHGFELVVNLGLLDPKYCLPDEARTVAALGMAYHHIPVDFQNPKASDFDEFRTVMRSAQGSKVFVHCAANYRVACFMALFGEAEFGWSREQADAHIKRLWEPNEVWARFVRDLRDRWASRAGSGQVD